MDPLEHVYLSGGNPHGTFTEAAQTIMSRAMPYMGQYNELYRAHSDPYQSTARGLSRDLRVPVETDNLFFCHGVKEAMDLSAQYVSWLSGNLQQQIRGRGLEPPKFQFLVRTPSYIHVLSCFQGHPNFDCKLVSAYDATNLNEHGGFNHLNAVEGLEQEISLISQDRPFAYTIGYLDINPCNPSGHVRGMVETVETARVLSVMRMANRMYLEKIFGKSVRFKREPFIAVEDHIYRGLEHNGEQTTSFCQLGPDWQRVTQTVFGVAKYGLVGMRGSVTVAPAYDTRMLKMLFERRNSDISPFSVLSCEYMFGDNPEDRATREKFLADKTREYERSTLIAAAIIDGKAQDFLSPEEYHTATTWLQNYGQMDADEAHKLLADGIPGLKVVNMPRAGFFLLLDYNGWINFADDESNFLPANIIKFIREVADNRFAMHLGDSAYMGLDDELNAVTRFTVAVPPADLIDRLLRLRRLGDYMNEQGPLNSENLPDASNLEVERPRASKAAMPARLQV